MKSLQSSIVIAIDGPSSVGKGTVARAIAEWLGYRHVDSGALYRAVAWEALRRQVDLENEPAVLAVAREGHFVFEGGRVTSGGTDITEEIRTPRIDAGSASVGRLPKVREVLVSILRSMAVGGVVMEGRDIGSDVFPDAPVKVYLDASPDVRARRRVLDQAHQAGRSMTGAEVGDALLKRDSIDRTRAVAPLQVPDGAVLLDTSTLERQEVLEAVKAVVRGKLPDLV